MQCASAKLTNYFDKINISTLSHSSIKWTYFVIWVTDNLPSRVALHIFVILSQLWALQLCHTSLIFTPIQDDWKLHKKLNMSFCGNNKMQPEFCNTSNNATGEVYAQSLGEAIKEVRSTLSQIVVPDPIEVGKNDNKNSPRGKPGSIGISKIFYHSQCRQIITGPSLNVKDHKTTLTSDNFHKEPSDL